MKYYCNDCNHIIDEDGLATRKERHEFWGAPYYEEFYMCPHCKGEDLEGVIGECCVCGKLVTSCYRNNNDEIICEECYENFDIEGDENDEEI